uniref:Uncharacterized protein n=1 Tax=Anguilla anguilla TaxID=7936 RepID=A0A0E9UT24_ANGAN
MLMLTKRYTKDRGVILNTTSMLNDCTIKWGPHYFRFVTCELMYLFRHSSHTAFLQQCNGLIFLSSRQMRHVKTTDTLYSPL